MQSVLMAASAAALLHSTLVSSQPLQTADQPRGPQPQAGVWALLPTECETPTALDLSTWPKCALPLGFVDDEVAALERPGPGKKATAEAFYSIARTHYAMAPGVPGGPAVAQVVVPMIFSRSYYYLAIAPESLDAERRFAAARGWPVACFNKDDGGCTAKSLADVQSQAAIEPTDPARLYRLVRITAPKPAPATPPTSEPPAPVVETPPPALKAPAEVPAPAPPPPAPQTMGPYR